MPADDEQIDISVVMHDLTSPVAENVDRKIKNIEDSADKAGTSVGELGDESEKSSKQVDDLGKSIDKTHKKTTRFDRMYNRFLGRFRRGNKYIAKHREEVDAVGRSYDKTRRKGQAFFTFGFNFGKLISAIKLSAIIEGLPLVATGLSAVGAGAVAAVSGLSPLVGIVGALGPGMFALASGIGVVKLATNGLGDAFKALSDPNADPAEVAAAMESLAPSARSFVKISMQLKEEWGDIQQRVQQTFFKGLGPALRELNTRAMPMLKGHLVDIAGVMNGVAIDFIETMSKRRNLAALNDVLKTNSRILQNIGDTIVAGGELGLWLTRAAGPMTKAMSGDFADWLTGKSVSARKNQDQLREFFRDSYDLLKKVIAVTSDFAHGLYNVGRASMPLAKSLGEWFTTMGEGFRAWTENEDNFERMQNFFREMRYPLKQFGLLIGSIGEGMLTLAENDDGTLGDLFKRLRTDIVPNLVAALDKAQGSGMIDALLDFAEAFVKLLDSGFIGASVPIVKALGSIANAIADFYAVLPDDMQTGIVGLLFLSSVLGKFRIGGTLGKGLGLGGLKGMLGKVTGGAVGGAGKFMGATPVYVVNMGLGGLGAGGAGGAAGAAGRGVAGGAAAGGLRAVVGRTLPKVAGGLAGGIAIGGLFEMFMSGVETERNIDNIIAGAGDMADIYDGIITKQQEIASLRKTIATGNTLNPAGAQEAIDAATKDLERLQARFDGLSTMSIPQYQQALSMLPDDVRTQVTTPGAVESEEDVQRLLYRLDLTPKEKLIAMSMLGVPATMEDIMRVQRELERIRDKQVTISVQARMDNLSRNLATGGAGFGPQAPGAWTGAPTKSGQWYWTGEQGPEAFVTRSGKIRMLGLNGPELVKPGAGAVVNADATADPFRGDPNKSPSWAVTALQRAVGAGAQVGAAKAADGLSGGSVSLQVGPIYPQTEMDVEAAVRRAWAKIEKERQERS